jgi:hypothetical protein
MKKTKEPEISDHSKRYKSALAELIRFIEGGSEPDLGRCDVPLTKEILNDPEFIQFMQNGDKGPGR